MFPILFIDNYEETLQGLDSVNRAEISSMIEKEIRTWVVENNGILNKLDKDKYVLFIEKQYVEQMEKNTFEILERVKNITDKTKLPITISIGMSYSENTLNERYMASSSALDIALGRGGDQVVIKKDKKFDFYGGSNLGLEKTSRVRARTIAQALKELAAEGGIMVRNARYVRINRMLRDGMEILLVHPGAAVADFVQQPQRRRLAQIVDRRHLVAGDADFLGRQAEFHPVHGGDAVAGK